MTQTSPSDSDLLPRLQKGDSAAFEVLVRRYHRQMVIVAYSIVGHAFAEEIVQESWLSIYQTISTFEQRSSLKTWLFTIVSNKARTRLVRENRIVSLDATDESESDFLDSRFNENGHWLQSPSLWEINTPDKLLEEAELQKCIEKTLSVLPDSQRSVFSLRDIQLLSLQEICNILGISESNVRVLLHRARQRLLQVIDHYQETGTC